jgi:beta-lactamase regulating signal transducer with metallopeptidase domain
MLNSINPALIGILFGVLGLLILWTLIWKGVALWHSARNHQKVWFIVFLIVNTFGILEIIYFLFCRKNKNNVVTTTTVTHTTTAATPQAPMPVAPDITPVPPMPNA